ncbi:phosphatase PAP2 family protein [Hydrogenophaga aquatica]
MASITETGWRKHVLSRLWVLWPVKAAGTMAFMTLFFWAYFWLLRNPRTEPWTMPVLRVDEWVAFMPAGFLAYASLWVYVSLPPALMPDFKSLVRFGSWTAGLCVFCLGIFWLFPTQTPPFAIDWALHPELAFMKNLDAAGNAFPSLHVATAVYSAIWLRHQLREMSAPPLLNGLSVLHCLAIVWSTMAVRQHVFLDVLAGAIVGWAFAWAALRGERAASVGGASLLAAVPARD